MPGSEFTVSGVTPSGYNQTYVAIAGTTGTTLVGNPLSGPNGTLQAISNPGTFTVAGSAVSVILPGMAVLGGILTNFVAPYGTFASTGTGGTGTYGITVGFALGSFTFTGAISGTTLTVSSITAYNALSPVCVLPLAALVFRRRTLSLS